MDERLRQRLVGAVVLVAAAVIFVPMLLEREPETEPAVVREAPAPAAPRPPETTDARTLPLQETPLPSPGPAAAAKADSERASAPEPPRQAPSPGTAGAAPGFAVQLGTFSRAANATALRDRLVARGYPAFVRTEGGGSGAVSRVYVGPQKDRAAAERELEKLLGETKLRGIVVNHPG